VKPIALDESDSQNLFGFLTGDEDDFLSTRELALLWVLRLVVRVWLYYRRRQKKP